MVQVPQREQHKDDANPGKECCRVYNIRIVPLVLLRWYARPRLPEEDHECLLNI